MNNIKAVIGINSWGVLHKKPHFLRQTCSPPITVEAVTRKKCFLDWKSVKQRILRNTSINTMYSTGIFNGADDVLTYLIQLGYLAYDRTFKTAFIPNEEIRQELILATKKKKWDKSVRAALDQIKDRKYPESVVGYAGELLLVGINYNGKRKNMNVRLKNMKNDEFFNRLSLAYNKVYVNRLSFNSVNVH